MISEASVTPATPGTGFKVYAEAARTGLAVTNTFPVAVLVSLETFNLNGSPTGVTGSVSVPAGGQIAQFVNQLLPSLSSSFRGIIRLTAALPIHVTSLQGIYNERGDFLMTTVPSADEAAGAATGSELMFPHFLSGGGYSTQFILLNGSSGSPISGDVYIRSRDGSLQTSTALQLEQQ
jgi:hypothetical protein